MIRILFVCHGNIYRSSMAEFIMHDMINRQVEWLYLSIKILEQNYISFSRAYS